MRYANFNIVNFLSNVDNLLFNLIFDIIWLIYLASLIVVHSGGLLEILVLKGSY